MPFPKPAATSPLDRLIPRARQVIRFERAWPFAVLALVLAALFLALAYLGVWAAAPRVLRAAAAAGFAGAAAAALVAGVLRGRGVGRAEALRRLDRDSGLPHRPLSSGEDRLATGTDDPVTQALWRQARQRAAAAAARLRVAPPSPRLVDRDPYALRMAALLALVAAAFVAGPDKAPRLAAAFDWRQAAAPAPGARLDAWIDPPPYTGRPPVVLTGGAAQGGVTVPVHSTVVIRASGTQPLEIRATGGLTRPAAPAGTSVPARPATADQQEARLKLEGSGTLEVSREGRRLGPLALTALADRPPTIALIGTPAPTARGGFTITDTVADDYGVTGAEAAFSDPAPPEGMSLVRSLVPPPRLTLNLAAAPGGLGKATTAADLSDHPWAGAEVTMVLSARDEGGNTGLSTAVRLRLPTRPFGNPLARALVEQRQALVFDPDHREGVGLALDALMIGPDQFGTSKAVYLGLYSARRRLADARSDADLVALSDYLWQMALTIEEGDTSQVARDLKAAQQALREALQRGAPPEEIKRLTEELRKQMDRMLAEMMRKGERDGPQSRLDPNTKVVTQQQLQAMMQRMQELAEKGDTAAAQRLLDQLQSLMDNLRTARRGAAADQAAREMNRQMGELDKMTREQQALRDKTFKQGRRQSGPGEEQDEDAPQAGNEGSPSADGPQGGEEPGDLQGQQKGLRERLQDMQRGLRQLGMEGEQGLGDAEQAMKEAEQALGEGPSGNRRAVDAQARALQGLQKGAAGMAQQMARGQSDDTGEGQGQGGQVGQGRSGESGDDPLGRRRESRGQMETRGEAIDEGVAARAAQVLQELRRRLGNPQRPTEELDYLERLLQSN